MLPWLSIVSGSTERKAPRHSTLKNWSRSMWHLSNVGQFEALVGALEQKNVLMKQEILQRR